MFKSSWHATSLPTMPMMQEHKLETTLCFMIQPQKSHSILSARSSGLHKSALFLRTVTRAWILGPPQGLATISRYYSWFYNRNSFIALPLSCNVAFLVQNRQEISSKFGNKCNVYPEDDRTKFNVNCTSLQFQTESKNIQIWSCIHHVSPQAEEKLESCMSQHSSSFLFKPSKVKIFRNYMHVAWSHWLKDTCLSTSVAFPFRTGEVGTTHQSLG